MYQPSGLTRATSTNKYKASCKSEIVVIRTTPASGATRSNRPTAALRKRLRWRRSRLFTLQCVAQSNETNTQDAEHSGEQQKGNVHCDPPSRYLTPESYREAHQKAVKTWRWAHQENVKSRSRRLFR